MNNKTRTIAVAISSVALLGTMSVAVANGLTERELTIEAGAEAFLAMSAEVCFGGASESLETALEDRNDPEFADMFFETACGGADNSLLSL